MELTISLILLVGALLNAFLEGFSALNIVYIAVPLVLGALAWWLRRAGISLSLGKVKLHASVFAVIVYVLVIALATSALAPESAFQLAERINRSAKLIAAGDYDGAEKLLLTLERQEPTNPHIHLNLAAVYLKARRTDLVRQHLDLASPNAQQDPTLWYNYGMLYYQLEDLKNAQRHFDKALLLNPSMTKAAVYAGTMSFRLRELRKAIYYLSHAHLLSPESPEILLHLGRAHLELMNFTAAETALKAALELSPPKGLTEALKEQLAAVEAAKGGLTP